MSDERELDSMMTNWRCGYWELAVFCITLVGWGWVVLGAWDSSYADIRLLVGVLVALGIAPLCYGLLLRKNRAHGSIVFLFAVGLLIRLAFLGTPPLLSDDVYRYLWDGRVQVASHSPYGVAPKADSLDVIESSYLESERIRSRVNHPDIPTIYPPALQLAFQFNSRAGDSLWSWRLLILTVEIALVAGLLWYFRSRGQDLRWVVLYWWHPLAIVENAWSAHVEIIAVAGLFLALLFLERHRFWASAALGLAGAAKLLPFGALAFLWRRYGIVPVLVAVGAASLTVLPYLGTPLDSALAGLQAYSEGWYFNDVLYRPLGFALGFNPEDKTLESTQLWRTSLQLLWVWICLLIAWREQRALHAGLWMALAFVVLTPTLHPWYLLWVLPFSVALGHSAAYLLCSLVLLAYVANVWLAKFGVWIEMPIIRLMEFVPPAILFAVGLARRSWLRFGFGSESATV